MKASLTTPVAFLIFNRPSLTQKVFEAIAKARPSKLLVVADGPRFAEEAEKCRQARAIIQHIDWDCEVLTHFSDCNLGCKNRVSSGLNWVFSQVEEAIILEDDCLPTPSFFPYCEALLDRYRHDERVMLISGDNFQDGHSRTPMSYYFSKYFHIWGWASWRRAWQYYDVTLKTWPHFKQLGLLSAQCEHALEEQYWAGIFDRVFRGEINTWDYQWLYACWAQSGLAIVPDRNLISNIGFGVNATHTQGDNPSANLPVQDIWEIVHPEFMVRQQEADRYTLRWHYGVQSPEELAEYRSSSRVASQTIKKVIKQVMRRTIYG